MNTLPSTILIFFVILFSGTGYVYASINPSIDAKIKVGVCGNGIKESGEECDGSDRGGINCANLGFTGGMLSCTSACDFNLSDCQAPTIVSSNVAPSDINSLLAAGLFTVPSDQQTTSTTSVYTASQIVINVPQSSSSSAVILPESLTISREDGLPFNPTSDLSVGSVSTSSIEGLTGYVPVSALQWGVTGAALTFDSPITINLFVDTNLKGDSLQIYRSEGLTNGWTTDGLVNTTCTVDANGICSFQTNKASYFVASETASTPTTTPTSSSSTSSTSSNSSSGSSSGGSTIQTIVNRLLVPFENLFKLPGYLAMFDTNNDNIIEGEELYNAVKAWVLALRGGVQMNCDLDNDEVCNLRDLSIMLSNIRQ